MTGTMSAGHLTLRPKRFSKHGMHRLSFQLRPSCCSPLCHLLSKDWISINAQQVAKLIGGDALAAVDHRAGDAGEDAGPLIWFQHVGLFVGQARPKPICRAVSTRVGGEAVRHQTVAVYRTRGQYATETAARAQLGENP